MCLKMVDVVFFNNVLLFLGNLVDLILVFVDVLKRVKEVRLFLRGCKCFFELV